MRKLMIKNDGPALSINPSRDTGPNPYDPISPKDAELLGHFGVVYD